jgi:hypothetical protein
MCALGVLSDPQTRMVEPMNYGLPNRREEQKRMVEPSRGRRAVELLAATQRVVQRAFELPWMGGTEPASSSAVAVEPPLPPPKKSNGSALGGTLQRARFSPGEATGPFLGRIECPLCRTAFVTAMLLPGDTVTCSNCGALLECGVPANPAVAQSKITPLEDK